MLICADLFDYLIPRNAPCALSAPEVSSPNFFILTHQFLLSTGLFFAIHISLHLIYFCKVCFQKKIFKSSKCYSFISAIPFQDWSVNHFLYGLLWIFAFAWFRSPRSFIVIWKKFKIKCLFYNYLHFVKLANKSQ